MTYIRKYWILITLTVLGAVSGFSYWYFIGCLGDSCAITSVWYNSTFYGLIMGGLLGMIFRDLTKGSSRNAQ